jgi:hypothetical protein
MPTGRDTEIRAAVHKAAQTAEPALPLRHGGPAGLADVRRRAAAARPRRRWGLAASLCLAVLVGLGGVAVAREPFDDPTDDVFSELHPDRSDSDTVEPHTLAGEMTLADGTQVRLHVTTATGPGSCGSVGRFSSGGRSEGTVGSAATSPLP